MLVQLVRMGSGLVGPIGVRIALLRTPLSPSKSASLIPVACILMVLLGGNLSLFRRALLFKRGLISTRVDWIPITLLLLRALQVIRPVLPFYAAFLIDGLMYRCR